MLLLLLFTIFIPKCNKIRSLKFAVIFSFDDNFPATNISLTSLLLWDHSVWDPDLLLLQFSAIGIWPLITHFLSNPARLWHLSNLQYLQLFLWWTPFEHRSLFFFPHSSLQLHTRRNHGLLYYKIIMPCFKCTNYIIVIFDYYLH